MWQASSFQEVRSKSRWRTPPSVRRQFMPGQRAIPWQPTILIQRACACGGACPRCAGDAVHPKLTVGSANDPLEHEADRVADQVMRMPDSTVPRVSETDEEEELLQPKLMTDDTAFQLQRQTEPEEEDELVQTKPLADQITPLVQRQVEPEEDEEIVQTKDNGENTPCARHDLQAQVRSLRGGGQPLPKTVRNFFEPRFGYDFSQVRVHTGSRASESARAINARAYTVGRDIVFRAGEYAPNTGHGRGLLAHEMTHVIQQQNVSTNQKQLKLAEKNLAVQLKPPASTVFVCNKIPTSWTSNHPLNMVPPLCYTESYFALTQHHGAINRNSHATGSSGLKRKLADNSEHPEVKQVQRQQSCPEPENNYQRTIIEAYKDKDKKVECPVKDWENGYKEGKFLKTIQPGSRGIDRKKTVHEELQNQLELAEKELEKNANYNKIKESVRRISGRRQPDEKGLSYHYFGLAIDIDSDRNPYIGLRSSTEVQKILNRAQMLLLGKKDLINLQKKEHFKEIIELFERYREASNALKRYFEMRSKSRKESLWKCFRERVKSDEIERWRRFLREFDFYFLTKWLREIRAILQKQLQEQINLDREYIVLLELRLKSILHINLFQKLQNLIMNSLSEQNRKEMEELNKRYMKKQKDLIVELLIAQITNDYNFLRKKAGIRNPELGFMNLNQHIVQALVKNGNLRWGATFKAGKDIMHFDYRSGTIKEKHRDIIRKRDKQKKS